MRISRKRCKSFKVLRDDEGLPTLFMDDVELPAGGCAEFHVDFEACENPMVTIRFTAETVVIDHYSSVDRIRVRPQELLMEIAQNAFDHRPKSSAADGSRLGEILSGLSREEPPE